MNNSRLHPAICRKRLADVLFTMLYMHFNAKLLMDMFCQMLGTVDTAMLTSRTTKTEHQGSESSLDVTIDMGICQAVDTVEKSQNLAVVFKFFKVFYYFKVVSGKTVCFYNQIGPIKELNPYYNFQIMPGFKTPQWAKGAVMYQIFVDRFCDGDKSNNVLDHEYSYLNEHVCQVTDWNKYPAQMGVREFYGWISLTIFLSLEWM